jgi:hypothetical protein
MIPTILTSPLFTPPTVKTRFYDKRKTGNIDMLCYKVNNHDAGTLRRGDRRWYMDVHGMLV